MKQDEYISINELCIHYRLDTSFFSELAEMGLVELKQLKGGHFVHLEKITHVEKMIRLHQDLDINLQGLDTILNLLERIDLLKEELDSIKNRLRLYESDEE